MNSNSNRVSATPAALALLGEIIAEHGPVLFHQSGGCCDGSSPMCYPVDDFRIGAGDVLLGHVGEAPFYIGALQAKAWSGGASGGASDGGGAIALLLDAVPGRGGMFSLDNGREQRFLIRSGACAI